MSDPKPNTAKIHETDVSSLGRRKFLQTLTGLGFGLTSAAYLTAGDVEAAPDDKVPIVYALTRKTPGDSNTEIIPKKKYVPADWYDNLKYARMVREEAKLRDVPGVAETSVRPGKYGGKDAYINVGVSHFAAEKEGTSVPEAKDRIPEQIRGVQVEVEEVGTPKAASCYDTDYGEYPPIGVKVEEDSGGYGTLCSPLHKDGNIYFHTVQHLWYGENPIGQEMYHPESYDKAIGEIVDSHCREDFVAAEPRNGHDPTQQIVDSDLTVVEQYTKDGLDDLIASGSNLYKKGVRTCYTYGEIKASDGYIGYVEGGCDDRYNQVKWGCCEDFKEGDSGSLSYRAVGSGQASAAGICAGYDPLANDTVFGTGAYAITDKFGYTFM